MVLVINNQHLYCAKKEIETTYKTLIKYNRQTTFYRSDVKLSHNDSILNLLNLNDENIRFEESFYSAEVIKGVESKVFHATLTYIPYACHSCGHIFDNNITKHGFKVILSRYLTSQVLCVFKT